MRRMRVIGTAAATVALAGMAVAATGGAGDGAAQAAAPTKLTRDRLASFDGCTRMRGYAAARAAAILARDQYGGYPTVWTGTPLPGRDVAPGLPAPVPVRAPAAAPSDGSAPVTDAPGGEAAPVEGVDYSGTNVQEAGIDEPDIVKTDGRVLFLTKGDRLHAVRTDGTPRSVGRLALAGADGAQLLLVGDRLLVVTGRAPVPVDVPIGITPDGPVPVPAPGDAVAGAPAVPDAVARQAGTRPIPPALDPARGIATLTVRMVDVSDPGRMRLLETLELEGRLVGARASGGSVRLVVSTPPDAVPLTYAGTVEAPDPAAALAVNREAVRRSPARTWLPVMRLTRAGRAPGRVRVAVACRDVRRPRQFSGLGTMNVLTIVPSAGLRPVDSDGVMTDGDIVYASARSLYVTTPRWIAPDEADDALPDGAVTQIHRFDTAAPRETRYRTSGRVPGVLLNQFAMSEQTGLLRVASTRDPTGATPGDVASESMVTVLAERDGRLTAVGRVAGLGRGERIQSVRFIGDTGYVVTFRRTDPLYVVDLSEPARPVVRGALKIPGFSAYLHPVGDGLLLGVGQDADPATGRTTGAQVSLFDVRDPASPRRLRALDLQGDWSEVEADHHAFLFWARTGLAVVPVASWRTGGIEAVGVRIGGGDLATAGRIVHPRGAGVPAAIRRSLVIGGRLVTVSDRGVGVSGLASLAGEGFLPVE